MTTTAPTDYSLGADDGERDRLIAQCATQDVDWISWTCIPEHPDWDRLAAAAASVWSGDVRIGRRLPALLRDAGLVDVEVDAHTRVFSPGDPEHRLLLRFHRDSPGPDPRRRRSESVRTGRLCAPCRRPPGRPGHVHAVRHVLPSLGEKAMTSTDTHTKQPDVHATHTVQDGTLADVEAVDPHGRNREEDVAAAVPGSSAGRERGAAVLRAVALRRRGTLGWIPPSPEVVTRVLANHRTRRETGR